MLTIITAALIKTGRAAVLTLSGETITKINSGSDATAGIRFNSDGTIDMLQDGVYTQIDVDTDWIKPNAAGALQAYDVGFASLTGDGWSTEAAISGAYVDISTNPVWSLTTVGVESLSNTSTFRIRDASGTILVSASYTVNAQRI